MELGLQGRRVLVTGGSQGIGLAVACGFLGEGASVTIVARDERKLARAAAELSAAGQGAVAARAADLARRGAPEAIADAFRGTDILVNNAGAISHGDIFAVDEVANVILFLASDRASWVSGVVVSVDGGFLHRQDWF